jgi:DNA-directed RNA polymerase
MDTKEIKYSVLGKRKSITLNTQNNKVDLRKQNLGVIPNIVHSMDAANISLLIQSILDINSNMPIITIHDCFGSTANNVQLLSHHVKYAFLSIYSDKNFVEKYHSFIINYLKNLGVDFNEDSTAVYLDNLTLNIPQHPIFDKNVDLKSNILLSKYFLH